ncbi:phage tail tape measure protein [Enterococcus gallinarum]|uniref:Phage tail tape measure protein n=1 Tax=Enterococcus gallinarum TaxID=1353 RepID=A0AAE7MRV7_ENTGA|nr:phage tail tape measure protein [Enterococcus gallinarum]MBM6741845.1 phage tail tape measure protein [Enterococcus gallinarum]QOG28466.1 phage tail tape measure protein [Enterococcus gallinarum]RBT42448.1 phage tail tape measure protein, TP901 family, core region [Enterococcus gallinarum]ROY69725.1 phage tail tape measure protein [Enterococcus gallinarum]ROZ07962.1 phage tail tape measure protein [Enterococcus gallinarum]
MAGSVRETDVVLNFKTNGEVNYSKTIKGINREMNLAATEFNNQMSAMDKNATATEKLTVTKKKLETQLTLAEKRTQLLREQYEKSVEETGKYSAESEKLYKKMLESETGQNKLKAALDETNEALKEQGDVSIDTAKKLQKIEEAGEKVSNVGKKMSIGVTAPIMAAGAAGLAAFSEVDEAMDTIIQKTGATGDVADRLSTSFENVGSNTHLELQTVGEAIGEVNTQFGFMDKKLEDSTDYLLKYADINNTDVSQAAIYARQSIEAYELSYDDLNDVLDVTTKTSQDTGQSVDDLMKKAIDGAPQIKQLGLSFDEGVTLIGKFEQAGVDSSTMLSKMSKASVVYAKDNLSLQDGLKGTIDSILNAKDETEALRIANEVFGKGSDKMVDAIQRGTFTLDDLAKVAKESGGAVADTFAETEDPIDAANRAMNNAKFALADVGESVQISLLPFFEMAIDALKSFKGWWDSLDQGTKTWIITLAGIAAVIGPALVVIGTLMSSVTKITAGVKDLATVWSGLGKLFGLSGGWFAVAVIAIAALVAGLVWAYNNVEWFRNGVNAFFQGVSDIAVEVFNFMGGYISNIFGGIIQNFQNFFDAGKRIFTGFIDFITGIFTGDWERAWNGVVNIFGGIFDGIAAMAKAPFNGMIGLINAFLGGLNNIKIPKWVPGVGGKSFSISTLPYLADGGHVLNGQAIVGEAGPELLTNKNGKTTVTPLSDEEKRKGIGGKVQPSKVEQHIHIGNVDANNPSELNKLNRKMYKASQQALGGIGG